ncbi:MAG: dethiobiotin synthase [Planctomycetota bacterium]
MVKGLFVTGTDTGVGKTVISCSFVHILREQMVDAVGFKPVATGKVGDGWSDATALHEASGKCEPIEKICPLRFALPLAPTLAARAEGLGSPDLNLARHTLTQLCTQHDAVIVEGIGGVLTPLDEQTLVIDFMAKIAFPALIVCRAGLGTINHTLLTVREIQRANLPLVGIVMNCTRAEDVNLMIGAKEEIERISGQRVIAMLPYFGVVEELEPPQSSFVARVSAALTRQVNVKALLYTINNENFR